MNLGDEAILGVLLGLTEACVEQCEGVVAHFNSIMELGLEGENANRLFWLLIRCWLDDASSESTIERFVEERRRQVAGSN